MAIIKIDDIPEYIVDEFPFLCGELPVSPYDYCEQYLSCSIQKRFFKRRYGKENVTICSDTACFQKKLSIYVETRKKKEYANFLEAMKLWIKTNKNNPDIIPSNEVVHSIKKRLHIYGNNEEKFKIFVDIIDNKELAIDIFREFDNEIICFQKSDLRFLNQGITKYKLTSITDIKEFIDKNKSSKYSRAYLKSLTKKFRLIELLGKEKFVMLYETSIRYGFIFKREYLDILIQDHIDPTLSVGTLLRKYHIKFERLKRILKKLGWHCQRRQ